MVNCNVDKRLINIIILAVALGISSVCIIFNAINIANSGPEAGLIAGITLSCAAFVVSVGGLTCWLAGVPV